MATQGGFSVSVNSPDLAKFYKDIAKLESSKAVAKRLRKDLRETVKPIVSEVKREARALPGKPKTADDIRYEQKMGGTGVGLRAGLAAATEAKTRALPDGMFIRVRISGTKFAAITGKYRKLPRYVEGMGRRRWRHPVFADKGATNGAWTGKWVQQEPTPFLFDTVTKYKEEVREAVFKAFDKAIMDTGWFK